MKLVGITHPAFPGISACRAGISIATPAKIESGSPSVAIGNYMQMPMTPGLDGDMAKVAPDDEPGRKIQDAGLTVCRRASKRSSK